MGDKENKILLKRYVKFGDLDAYNQLMENNLDLVKSTILNVIKSDDSNEEKISQWLSAGTIGLSNAIKSFSFEKSNGTPFAWYAWKCIKNELINAIKAESINQKYISFDEVIKVHDRYYTKLKNTIIDPNDATSNYDKSKRIFEAYMKLNDRERYFLELCCGLNGKQKMSVAEIAKNEGISRSRVSEIIKRAKEKLEKELGDLIYNSAKNKDVLSNPSLISRVASRRLDDVIKNCDKKLLKSIFSKLTPREYFCFSAYYGMNGCDVLSIEHMANKLKVTPDTAKKYVYSTVKNIKQMILTSDFLPKRTIKEDYIPKLYRQYGKEKVDYVISLLEPFEAKVFSLYYGTQDNVQRTTNDIAKEFSCNERAIVNSLNRIRGRILTELSFEDAQKEQLMAIVYSMYSEEALKEALKVFNKEQKDIFCMYFGIGYLPVSKKMISLKYNMSLTVVSSIINYVGNILQSANQSKIDDNSKKLLCDERQSETTLENNNIEQEYENIKSAVDFLDSTERTILFEYYGIDNIQRHNISELARKYKMDEDALTIYLGRAVSKLNMYINLKKQRAKSKRI